MPSAWVLFLFAFSIWMLVDAVRRSAPLHWYFVILFLPLGALIYFFMVKIRDFDLRRSPAGRNTARAVPDARGDSRPPPALEAELAIADALEKSSRHEEATVLYQDVLARSPENLRALHGLARCRLGDGRFTEAVELLDRVVTRDREFGDYAAALDYVEALYQAGRHGDAVELAEAMANTTERLNHHLAHAHYLALSGDTAGAHAVVLRGLAEHEKQPAEARDRQRRWVKRAEEMLEHLARGESPQA